MTETKHFMMMKAIMVVAVCVLGSGVTYYTNSVFIAFCSLFAAVAVGEGKISVGQEEE